MAEEPTGAAEQPGDGGTPPADNGTPPGGAAQPTDGGSGGGEKRWFDDFTDPSLRELAEAKGYKNPEQAMNAYRNLLRYQGGAKNVVEIPGDDADPETLQQFHRQVGAPETPDAYEIKLPESVEIPEQNLNAVKGIFHEAGLTPRQAQIVAEKWQEHSQSVIAEKQKEITAEHQAAIDAMKQEAGADWDAQVAAGRRAMEQLGLDNDDLAQLDEAMGVPAVVKLLTKAGAVIGQESKYRGGGQQMTPATAKEKIAGLKADESFQKVLRDRTHPEHKKNLDTWQRLHQIAGSSS